MQLIKILLIIACGSFIACKPAAPAPVNYQFKQGQILLPDYVCQDTLIVRDAAGLNNAMLLIDNGTIEATDQNLYSILLKHCDFYAGSFEDQFLKLSKLLPAADSLAIIKALKED